MAITFLIQKDSAIEFSIERSGGVIPVPPYTGAYEVDPSFSEQILQTKNKRMTDDVSVHAIEVQRTSNPQGGLTVYIGGILNG